MSDAEIEAVRDHWQRDLTRATQTIADVGRERNQLRADLAAANATIAALQADLAGTAELLLREQALAESRRLALATMREALEDAKSNYEWLISGASGLPRISHADTSRERLNARDAITKVLCKASSEVDAVLAQPDDAAALAGAVLEAADRMAGAIRTGVRELPRGGATGGGDPNRTGQDLIDSLKAYRRARAALRGGGAAEG